ncbi:MAG: LysR family transcriptional regulator [Acetatifactor sp.]|nr:LysR family transcriptional regulator [Acetatifactor sp.]
MDKQQLEYFEKLTQTMSVTKTAEVLHISQSSLSQTIKRLEGEVGYPLFTRQGKHLSLNANGEIFLDFVRRTRQGYEAAMTQIQELCGRQEQELSLFVGCASLFLPQLLTFLKSNTSHISFRVSQWDNSSEEAQDADLKIVASADPITSSCAFPLLKERILLAIPKGHPLLSKKALTLQDLTTEEFISLGSGWSLEKMIMDTLSAAGFQPNISIRVDNPTILRKLLHENLGLAFIPEKTWGDSFANGDTVLRKVTGLSILRYVYLIKQDGFSKLSVRTCIPLIQDFFARLFNVS